MKKTKRLVTLFLAATVLSGCATIDSKTGERKY